ncbi:nuclease [Mycobacterium avium]|nr:ParB N-terminal domain-containing protein [Mycobacterium avium]PBA38795.1 nuclease [Mycobacterium avium]PBA78706.1 nuclease [Mycobacterium avium]
MTDTITDTQRDDEAAAEHEAGSLEHLDPHTLIVDTNVRNVADLKAEFIASIKEHGVLTPIVAIRADDGQVLVRMGQRRTLAAREAGLTSVPVYVRPLAEGDDIAHLIDRVSQQIVENDHRAGITESERAQGIQQLLDAGVSVTKVAKKLSVKKDTVKAAETVGKSAAAKAALDTGQLSLTEAAALTEFEDLPGALDRLTSAAGTSRFDHVVAQLREEQASWQAQLKAEAHWREKGFTVLDERPRPWDIDCVDIGYLRSATGERVEDDVVTDPALWAVLVEEEEAWVDAETGEAVDESTIDWNTEDDPEATPAEGLRHFNTITDGIVYVPTYYCLNYSAAGFTLDSWFLRNAGVASTSTDSSTDGDAADRDTDSDDAAAARAAALAKAQAEEAETLRRERRKVIALNRLGDAAMQVRREFVTKLLARKTPPKGAAIFVADCMIREPALISDYHGSGLTAELLGVSEGEGLRKLVTDLPPTGDSRAQVLTLAVVLGALEARTPKDAWRSGGSTGWRRGVGTTEYLAFLVANGYQLADVERVITGERTSDEVYDDTLSASEDKADDSDGPDPQPEDEHE